MFNKQLTFCVVCIFSLADYAVHFALPLTLTMVQNYTVASVMHDLAIDRPGTERAV